MLSSTSTIILAAIPKPTATRVLLTSTVTGPRMKLVLSFLIRCPGRMPKDASRSTMPCPPSIWATLPAQPRFRSLRFSSRIAVSRQSLSPSVQRIRYNLVGLIANGSHFHKMIAVSETVVKCSSISLSRNEIDLSMMEVLTYRRKGLYHNKEHKCNIIILRTYTLKTR